MIITTNLEIIDNSTNHTLIILPANIRTLILDASDDIRYNDPKVHRQLVDERIKQLTMYLRIVPCGAGKTACLIHQAIERGLVFFT